MTDQEDNFILGEFVFDDNIQERKPWDKLYQIFNRVFVPTFCHFVDYLWLSLARFSLKNLLRINRWGGWLLFRP